MRAAEQHAALSPYTAAYSMVIGILIVLHSLLQEVLKELQGSIEEESMGSSGQIDLLERLKGRALSSCF